MAVQVTVFVLCLLFAVIPGEEQLVGVEEHLQHHAQLQQLGKIDEIGAKVESINEDLMKNRNESVEILEDAADEPKVKDDDEDNYEDGDYFYDSDLDDYFEYQTEVGEDGAKRRVKRRVFRPYKSGKVRNVRKREREQCLRLLRAGGGSHHVEDAEQTTIS